MPVALLREMFEHMVVAKNAELIGRVWLTTSRPGEKPTRIEVVLIAAYRGGAYTASGHLAELARCRGVRDLLIARGLHGHTAPQPVATL